MLLGAVVGSFINCVRMRWPAGQSLRHPPSFCDSCGTTLGLAQLVPILSYLAQRGRCHHCHAGIPVSTLWVEVATTLWPLLLGMVLPTGPLWAVFVFVGWVVFGWALTPARKA